MLHHDTDFTNSLTLETLSDYGYFHKPEPVFL